MIILITVAFAVAVMLELPGLIRKRYWRELAVYLPLLLAGFLISLALAMDIKLPPVSTRIGELIIRILGIK